MLSKTQKRRPAYGQAATGPRENGFTIIEVLIVLAIAGLIMVIVFLAVPSLQRNQRNQSRKTDGKNIISLADEYVSNNGNMLPAAACTGTTGATPCAFLTNYKPANFIAANVSYIIPGAAIPAAPDFDHLIVVGGGACSSATTAPTSSAAGRTVAVWYGLEGSVATQCVSQ